MNLLVLFGRIESPVLHCSYLPKALHSSTNPLPTGFRITCENEAILAGALVFVVCDMTEVGSPSPADVDAVTYANVDEWCLI